MRDGGGPDQPAPRRASPRTSPPPWPSSDGGESARSRLRRDRVSAERWYRDTASASILSDGLVHRLALDARRPPRPARLAATPEGKALADHAMDRLIVRGGLRRRDHSDGSPAVGYDDTLALTGAAQELAQSILQLSDAHGRHGFTSWPHYRCEVAT